MEVSHTVGTKSLLIQTKYKIKSARFWIAVASCVLTPILEDYLDYRFEKKLSEISFFMVDNKVDLQVYIEYIFLQFFV